MLIKKLNSCELKTSYLCVFLQRCVYSVLIAGLVSPSDPYKISRGDVLEFLRIVDCQGANLLLVRDAGTRVKPAAVSSDTFFGLR